MLQLLTEQGWNHYKRRELKDLDLCVGERERRVRGDGQLQVRESSQVQYGDELFFPYPPHTQIRRSIFNATAAAADLVRLQ